MMSRMLDTEGLLAGVMMVWGGSSFEWTPKDVHFFESFASLGVSAIDNARRFDHAQRRAEKVHEMQQHCNNIANKSHEQDVLDTASSLAKPLLDAEHVFFHQIDPIKKTIWQVDNSLIEEAGIHPHMPIDTSILPGCVAHSGECLVVQDPQKDDRVSHTFDRENAYVTKHLLAVPWIHPQTKEILGVAQCLNKKSGGPFQDFDVELAEAYFGQVAVSLKNSQEAAQARTREHQLKRLVQGISTLLPLRDVLEEEDESKMGHAIDPDELLTVVLEVAAEIVGGDRVSIHLLDKREGMIWSTHSNVLKKGKHVSGIWTEVGMDLLSEILNADDSRLGVDANMKGTKLPTVIEDAAEDSRFDACDELSGDPNDKFLTKSMIVTCVRNVPVLKRKQSIAGKEEASAMDRLSLASNQDEQAHSICLQLT